MDFLLCTICIHKRMLYMCTYAYLGGGRFGVVCCKCSSKVCDAHKMEAPPTSVTTTREECLALLTEMMTIRRMETAAGEL